jgi:hypothetical protein
MTHRRFAPIVVLALAFLLSLACSSVPLPGGLGGPTPQIQCSPPPCAVDETYACGAPSGDCPGGCGTICIKKTADPNAPPTPTFTPPAGGARSFVCPIVVRTPPPEAPTASVNGTASPNDFVDPHVELCAGATEIAVGSTVQITAQAVDIGLPFFQVSVRPEGAADFVQLVEVTYDNQVRNLSTDPIGEAFVFSQAQGSNSEMTLELLATAPGTLEVRIGATGEIHYGYPGPATWGGGGSEVMVLRAVGPWKRCGGV